MHIPLHIPKTLKHWAEQSAPPIRALGSRLLGRETDAPKPRAADTDLSRYELTPFGRRRKGARRKKVLVTASALGAVALAAWLLV